MGLREDREYLAQRKAEREAIKEAAEKQAIDEYNKRCDEREDLIAAHEAKIDRFYQYKDDVKKTLLTEALGNIYKDSIYHISDREAAICEALLGEYIDEVGTTQLLRNMKFSESALLKTIQEEVDEYAADITADATAEDPASQTIEPTKVQDFWKEVDKSDDIEDITNMIRLRVADAEEKFINQNQDDKADIDRVLSDTADRIKLAKSSNDNDYSVEVEESETRLAKDKIYQIQHETHNRVFDRMVRNIAESVMNHDEMKAEYTRENGGLDMDKIVESARCMYTLLEMVSTIGLENVDQDYIEDTLKSIK